MLPYDDNTGKTITQYKPGVTTIGYGHLITSQAEFDKYKKGISVGVATNLFNIRLQEFEGYVNHYVKRHLHNSNLTRWFH